ncbi:MAG: hypothetical protein KBD01_08375 [Acidobacteria bacterium]|nr:hypothetical protein [Acidobacteriota bacterium]
MSTEESRLREEWRERTPAGPAPRGCLEAEQVWRAVTLETSARERRSVIDHMSNCARCAEIWRLASELSEHVPARAQAVRRRRRVGLPRLALAAAALVAAVGLGWFALQRGTDQSVLRATEPGLRSLLEDGAALPREHFLLRWTPGPPGTIYDIQIATTELRLVTRGVALTTPEFLVPERALTDLARGTSIAWRVEATLPDGHVVSSVTYFNVVR